MLSYIVVTAAYQKHLPVSSQARQERAQKREDLAWQEEGAQAKEERQKGAVKLLSEPSSVALDCCVHRDHVTLGRLGRLFHLVLMQQDRLQKRSAHGVASLAGAEPKRRLTGMDGMDCRLHAATCSHLQPLAAPFSP